MNAPTDKPSGKALSQDREQPLVAHLVELRARLIASGLAVLLVFGLLSFFANDLYEWLAAPLLRLLPGDATMIATDVAAPFLAPFKLTAVVALIAAMPYVLYQAWRFIAPGLYRHEQRLVLPLIISSTLLFYLGIAFAYYVVFPILFGFFTATAPEGVTVMTDINRYLDFVLSMFVAFGAVFEIPVATLLLLRTGVISRAQLIQWRPYVIVACFVLAAILTPPDVISQTLLALPMWLLFEAGLFFSSFLPAPEINPKSG